MKWTEMKTEKGSIGNVQFECESNQHGLRTVTFYVDGKPLLMIGKTDYSSMNAHVPAPPKIVDRYVLSGKFLGLTDVSEEFEDEFAAEQRKNEFLKLANYPEDEKLGISINKQKVEVAA